MKHSCSICASFGTQGGKCLGDPRAACSEVLHLHLHKAPLIGGGKMPVLWRLCSESSDDSMGVGKETCFVLEAL
jgi:hypothetical protein